MSHFTKLAKANITSANAFAKAAEELGLKVSLNSPAVSYHGRNKIDNADVVIHMIEGDDIALTKNDETGFFDMQADWGYMGQAMVAKTKFKNIGDLQDRLIQLTTKNTIVDKYRREGWRAEFSDAQNGDLNLKLSRAD